jgi:hypothetical protein
MIVSQTTSIRTDPTTLLGAILAANPSESFHVGAYPTVTVSSATGWQWIDGTSPVSLNCGSSGCGGWTVNSPEYVPCPLWLSLFGPTSAILTIAFSFGISAATYAPVRILACVSCGVGLVVVVGAAPSQLSPSTMPTFGTAIAWTTRLAFNRTRARRTCVPRASIPWAASDLPPAVARALQPPAATAGWA